MARSRLVHWRLEVALATAAMLSRDVTLELSNGSKCSAGRIVRS